MFFTCYFCFSPATFLFQSQQNHKSNPNDKKTWEISRWFNEWYWIWWLRQYALNQKHGKDCAKGHRTMMSSMRFGFMIIMLIMKIPQLLIGIPLHLAPCFGVAPILMLTNCVGRRKFERRNWMKAPFYISKKKRKRRRRWKRRRRISHCNNWKKVTLQPNQTSQPSVGPMPFLRQPLGHFFGKQIHVAHT